MRLWFLQKTKPKNYGSIWSTLQKSLLDSRPDQSNCPTSPLASQGPHCIPSGMAFHRCSNRNFFPILTIVGQHLLDIMPSLPIRRNLLVPIDFSFSCVVGSQRQTRVTVKPVEKIPKMPCSSSHILIGI